MKRTESVKIRLSKIEKNQIIENSNGLKVAVWLRELALGNKSKSRKPIPKADPELIRELARIGNNINQIARLANENKKSGFDFNAFAVLQQLQEIESQLELLK
ncbi:MobC family plasmid mobilization relaxosome protein [Salinicola halophilus]|uniref:MobC family plasmid mobilization relaxosome protein n=1 Tax=Salinicola halophilus TaxID=184065 RepID=UPI000DA119E6|nr:MobC family plasmid mobilization relaxosome protein [Salinicola halophilus]